VSLDSGTLVIPPPADKVADWPLIGKKVHKAWGAAANNLEATLSKYSDQLKAFSRWLLKTIASTAAGVLAFAFSIIIAGVLMLGAEQSYQSFRRIGRRLAGEKGADFTDLAVATIRALRRAYWESR